MVTFGFSHCGHFGLERGGPGRGASIWSGCSVRIRLWPRLPRDCRAGGGGSSYGVLGQRFPAKEKCHVTRDWVLHTPIGSRGARGQESSGRCAGGHMAFRFSQSHTWTPTGPRFGLSLGPATRPGSSPWRHDALRTCGGDRATVPHEGGYPHVTHGSLRYADYYTGVSGSRRSFRHDDVGSHCQLFDGQRWRFPGTNP